MPWITHTTLATGSLPRLAVTTVIAGVLLFGTSAAHAAFKTAQCLAAKVKAAGTLQKCRATEEAKQLLSKPADPAKCQTKFQGTLAKLDTKAAKAGIGCHYRDNGNGTVTDFDTGLQWEKKDGAGGGQNLANPHDVDNRHTWGNFGGCSFVGCPNGMVYTDFLGRLNNCTSSDGTAGTDAGFAGHCDWRLPTAQELQTILDMSAPGCGSGSPCIDPIFGPTAANIYWSATTLSNFSAFAWDVYFINGFVDFDDKANDFYVRAVRAGP